MWGVIGGSGFEKFDGFETVELLECQTPFGPCSSGLKKVKLEGIELLFLSRHGEHHELLPSEINYRANVFALRKMGADKILSVSAIGSLKKEFKPGDLVVPKQYIDRTKSFRRHTFCGSGVVGHVSLAQPICSDLKEILIGQGGAFDFEVHFDATYVCIEGPYFSTQAESNSYRQMGADIIGMTNFPEFALAREAGMHYLPCCFVTDYDCWDDNIDHVTLQEVIDVMRKNNGKAFQLLKTLIHQRLNGDRCLCSQGGLKSGLMTPLETLSPENQKWLSVLT